MFRLSIRESGEARRTEREEERGKWKVQNPDFAIFPFHFVLSLSRYLRNAAGRGPRAGAESGKVDAGPNRAAERHR